MAEQPTEGGKPRTKVRRAAPIPTAYEAAQWEPADATALQALVRGDCPAHLQQRAINFIIYKVCGTYQPPFRAGGPEAAREQDFALGKQFVGQQLVGLLKVKTSGEGEQP